MQDDEVRDQLEGLRNEVRALSNAFIDLRQEDVRRVFGDQIRPILVERIEKLVSKRRKNEPREAGDQVEYKARLISLVDDAISIYGQSGKEKATRFLDDYESDWSNQRSSGNPPDSTSFVLVIIKELRGYFETSEGILHRSEPSGRLIGPRVSIKKAELSPIEVENTLGPLSNSWRIKVLMMLSKDTESLAGLSRALGLKKGHLQFHLRSLLDSGYIQYHRKSHLYSITAKGAIALDGVTRLVDRLASI